MAKRSLTVSLSIGWVTFSIAQCKQQIQDHFLVFNLYVSFSSRQSLESIFVSCMSQKFEDPAEGEEALTAKFKKLYEDLAVGFCNLEGEAPMIDQSHFVIRGNNANQIV